MTNEPKATPDGFFYLRGVKTADAVTYQVDVPEGYRVQVETLGGFKVVQRLFPSGKVNFGYKVGGEYQ